MYKAFIIATPYATLFWNWKAYHCAGVPAIASVNFISEALGYTACMNFIASRRLLRAIVGNVWVTVCSFFIQSCFVDRNRVMELLYTHTSIPIDVKLQ